MLQRRRNKLSQGSLWTASFFLLGCAAPSAESARAASDTIAPLQAAASITADEMRAHIAVLSSDELRGRETPSPGLERAAAYLAAEFERLGLEPLGDGGTFLQRYPFPLISLPAESVKLELSVGSLRRVLAYGGDYAVEPGATGEADVALVFAAGGVPPGAGGALAGTAVLVDLPGRVGATWEAARNAARAAAAAAGARAILFVLDPAIGADWLAGFARWMARPARQFGGLPEIPSFYLRDGAARELVRAAGAELEALRAPGGENQTRPLPLAGARAHFLVRPQVLDDAQPPNVVALLPGSDPALRDSYVIFSAHMDHLGVGPADATGDSIYNGADDDASGTAALLEIAEAFAMLSPRPARSLIFLAVSGEEKGLLGSAHFTARPPIPLGQVVANFNIDMIGRNAPDSVVAVGAEYTTLGGLAREVAAQHPDLGLTVADDPWPEERFFFRSDHFHFAEHGVPALFVFAGVHQDYHQPSDEVDRVDADKAARIARLLFYAGNEVATGAATPHWTERGSAELAPLWAR